MNQDDNKDFSVISTTIGGAALGLVIGAIACPLWGFIQGWIYLMMAGSGLLAPIMIAFFGGVAGAIIGGVVGLKFGKDTGPH